MELTLEQKLLCPFPPRSVSWRIGQKTKDGSKAKLLAYIDARDVMERLDKACGFSHWQCRYNLAADGLLICEIGIRIPSPGLVMPDGSRVSEWLWRANGAGDTQVEAEKGKASDSFKRAAVLWGIGRYLYGLDTPWVSLDEKGKWGQDPQLPEWATPKGWMAQLQAEQERKS